MGRKELEELGYKFIPNPLDDSSGGYEEWLDWKNSLGEQTVEAPAVQPANHDRAASGITGLALDNIRGDI